MDISVLVLQIVIGVSTGMVTFLIAAGVSLVVSGLGVINFGQGAFYILGAFLCYAVVHVLNFWWAILLAPLGVALIGFLIEPMLRRVYSKNMLYQMLLTMGVAFVMVAGMQIIWGKGTLLVDMPSVFNSSLSFMGINFPLYRIFLIVVSGLFAISLWWMFEKTRLGMTFRAIICDRSMVGCLGVNVTLLMTVMFGYAMWLSGVAGVLLAPNSGIEAASSMNTLFNVFTVLIIGGLTTMRGTFFAAIIVGVVYALGTLYVPFLYTLIPGALMIIVLLVKPRGLFQP